MGRPKKRSVQPTEAALNEQLGVTRKHWDAFLTRSQADAPNSSIEWKSYTTGWRCLIRRKGRNLAYLIPGEDHFVVAFALSEAAVETAQASTLPPEVRQLIRDAERYPEGRAVRIPVKSAADLAVARVVFALKIGNAP